MIIKIVNQQLSKIISTLNSKRSINSYQNQYLLNLDSSWMFQNIEDFSKKKSHNFTFQTCYYYRSEERFIDFKKDYYEILGISESADLQ